MTILWWAIQLGIVALLAWSFFFGHEFYALNKFADDVERKMPKWFTWDARGDWISWVHHALWTALAGSGGGLITLVLLGAFRPGFQRFALGMLCFYVAREGWGLWTQRGGPGAWSRPGRKPTRVGWAVDGIMDVVGPTLIFWLSL